MTKATELAMNLAQLRLDLRKLTDRYRNADRAFDAAIYDAMVALQTAVHTSADAVHTFYGQVLSKAEPTAAQERDGSVPWTEMEPNEHERVARLNDSDMQKRIAKGLPQE
jgi:hypothetical protein